MTHEPPRDPLGEALRSLPRAAPREGFTERLLERADAPGPGRLPGPAIARWVAAATLATIALAGALSLPRSPLRPGSEHDRRERMEALEAERLRLSAELEEIRRLATTVHDPAPVLYLGGDEEVDVVLDLGRLAREHPSESDVTPAAYHGRPVY